MATKIAVKKAVKKAVKEGYKSSGKKGSGKVKATAPAGPYTTIRMIEGAQPCDDEYAAFLVDIGAEPIKQQYQFSFEYQSRNHPKKNKKKIGPDTPIPLVDVIRVESTSLNYTPSMRVFWLLKNACKLSKRQGELWRLVDRLETGENLALRVFLLCPEILERIVE